VERRVSVKAPFRILLSFLALLAMVPVALADHELVLVVANDSPIEELTALDMRKAYLGVAVQVEGRTIKPYRLSGNEHLNEVFMQSVIAMSERSYERRLLSLTLKYGRPRPVVVGTPAELIDALESDPMAIGYLWEEDAENIPAIRIVRILWRAD
jgi:hypothetical protein